MKVTDLNRDEVIHCKTRKEARAICDLMHEAGISRRQHQTNRNNLGVDTCYRPLGMSFDSKLYYEKKGYTIYPASDFLEKLKEEDTVIFGKIEYMVCSNHLSLMGGQSSTIFSELGINKSDFLSEAYGYKCFPGSWNASKDEDYEALYRAVKALAQVAYDMKGWKTTINGVEMDNIPSIVSEPSDNILKPKTTTLMGKLKDFMVEQLFTKPFMKECAKLYETAEEKVEMLDYFINLLGDIKAEVVFTRGRLTESIDEDSTKEAKKWKEKLSTELKELEDSEEFKAIEAIAQAWSKKKEKKETKKLLP